MKLKLFLSLFILALSSYALKAQVLSGVVTDKQTNQTVTNANVYVLNKTIGTMSNSKGEFIVENPVKGDTLVCSRIGYEDAYAIYDTLSSKHITFSIKPAEYVSLGVTADGMTAKDMIKKASSLIEQNYPSDYTTVEGILRKQSVEDGKMVFQAQANLGICYSSYIENNEKCNKKLNAKIFSVNIYNDAQKELTDGVVLFSSCILHCFKSVNLFLMTIDEYEWKFANLIKTSKGNIYQIDFGEKDGKSVGTVYLSANDYAFLCVKTTEKVSERKIAEGIPPIYNTIQIDQYFKKINSKWQLYCSKANYIAKIIDYEHNDYSTQIISKWVVTYDFLVQNSEDIKTIFTKKPRYFYDDIFASPKVKAMASRNTPETIITL